MGEWRICGILASPFLRIIISRARPRDGLVCVKRATPSAHTRALRHALLTVFILLQDGMITHHEVLENGSPADRCQVVHWIRSFPFAFISDREYVIARRQFRDANGCIYVMTKSVPHPRAPVDDTVVRM